MRFTIQVAFLALNTANFKDDNITIFATGNGTKILLWCKMEVNVENTLKGSTGFGMHALLGNGMLESGNARNRR